MLRFDPLCFSRKQPQQGGFVIAQNDSGVGAADEGSLLIADFKGACAV